VRTLYHHEHGPATVEDALAVELLAGDPKTWSATPWPAVTVYHVEHGAMVTSPGCAAKALSDPSTYAASAWPAKSA
jgi:hypothetical protein